MVISESLPHAAPPPHRRFALRDGDTPVRFVTAGMSFEIEMWPVLRTGRAVVDGEFLIRKTWASCQASCIGAEALQSGGVSKASAAQATERVIQ